MTYTSIYLYNYVYIYIYTYTVTIKFHNPPQNLAGSLPLSIRCFLPKHRWSLRGASFFGHKQDVYSSHLFKHLFNILEWQQRFCKWPTIWCHFLFRSTIGFVGCFQWSWFSRRWQKEPSSWRESGFTESWWLKGINSTDVWSQNQIYQLFKSPPGRCSKQLNPIQNPHHQQKNHPKKTPKHPFCQPECFGHLGGVDSLTKNHQPFGVFPTAHLPIKVTHFPHQTSVRNHSGPSTRERWIGKNHSKKNG